MFYESKVSRHSVSRVEHHKRTVLHGGLTFDFVAPSFGQLPCRHLTLVRLAMILCLNYDEMKNAMRKCALVLAVLAYLCGCAGRSRSVDKSFFCQATPIISLMSELSIGSERELVVTKLRSMSLTLSIESRASKNRRKEGRSMDNRFMSAETVGLIDVTSLVVDAASKPQYLYEPFVFLEIAFDSSDRVIGSMCDALFTGP
jgi:hypothetical protein